MSGLAITEERMLAHAVDIIHTIAESADPGEQRDLLMMIAGDLNKHCGEFAMPDCLFQPEHGPWLPRPEPIAYDPGPI